ncbi:MAG: acetolactate synthase small subunit [Chloroflexi bacterium]|nr:acetolactate synthase small subunit [Chloroflexota bacterium]
MSAELRKHTVVALVEDRPGVLNRVASLFRRRGFNIDSLAVGTTEEPGISRMTIVVASENGIVDQVQKQLAKLIDVIEVADLTGEDAVIRELALIKVACTTEQRREVLDLVDIFRARAVDVAPGSLIIQIVAEERQFNSLIENLEPYGILEMTRTGRIAMLRGDQTTAVHDPESEELQRFRHSSGRRPAGELPYVSD